MMIALTRLYKKTDTLSFLQEINNDDPPKCVNVTERSTWSVTCVCMCESTFYPASQSQWEVVVVSL